MQEAGLRPGRASPHNPNHKKAAVELYMASALSLATSPAPRLHHCNERLWLPTMKPEITCFYICFCLTPKLQGSLEIIWVWDQRYLGGFAPLPQTYAILKLCFESLFSLHKVRGFPVSHQRNQKVNSKCTQQVLWFSFNRGSCSLKSRAQSLAQVSLKL